VRNKGGQYCSVIFPIEKMLDHIAYIKDTIRIDMEMSISGGLDMIKKADLKLF